MEMAIKYQLIQQVHFNKLSLILYFMVKKAKKYLMPAGYGGLLYFEEEPESKIKLKVEHVIYISIAVGLLILILRFLI